MKTEVVEVTPAKAQAWLQKNVNVNRKVRSGVVQRYARDMRAGKWTMTHQAVAFDSKGRLIDGQHRLMAVVEAGVVVRMAVTTDAPSASFSHIDLGFSRTVSDVLRGEGDDWVTGDHVAISRLVEANGSARQALAGISPFEMKDLVYKHRNAVNFVLQNLERRVRGITTSPVLAGVASAYYTESDRIRLAEFCRVLVSGVVNDPAKDSAVIQLRDYLMANLGAMASGVRVEMYLKTQRTVKAFMRGEGIKKLYAPADPIYQVPKNAA